jgi:outer membrane protein OmpU
MKKILLGTSALCAVAMAGPAFAQSANEPVKLGIGGYWNSAYGYIPLQSGSQKGGKRQDDIDTDAILNIKGSTKLDNGFTVGASVQIRATDQVPTANVAPNLTSSTPDTIKRSYAYIRGDFGEFRIGDDDDARRQKALTAPIAGGGVLFGANTPDMLFSNGPAITNTTMRKLEQEKRISRLAYFTPTIAGFSFAVSYAPGGEKGGIGNANAPNLTQTNGANAINNAVSIAGAYNGKFGDFSLDAYVGGSTGHRMVAVPTANIRTGRDNPSAVAGGAVVGFGPFKFGGAYEYLNDRDLPVSAASGHQTRKTWDIGGEYIIGPFSVSLDWTRAILANREVNAGAINDIFALAGDYQLGPGIDLGLGIDYTHYQTSVSNAVNVSGTPYSGLAIMAGIGIGF